MSGEADSEDWLRAFGDLGPPPSTIPVNKTMVLRSASERQGTGIRLPEDFAQRLRERLPASCDYAYVFFLERAAE